MTMCLCTYPQARADVSSKCWKCGCEIDTTRPYGQRAARPVRARSWEEIAREAMEQRDHARELACRLEQELAHVQASQQRGVTKKENGVSDSH